MWKTWNIGDKVIYTVDDFDGHGTFAGEVIEKHEDHLIIQVDDLRLWCDDDFADMFRKEKQHD